MWRPQHSVESILEKEQKVRNNTRGESRQYLINVCTMMLLLLVSLLYSYLIVSHVGWFNQFTYFPSFSLQAFPIYLIEWHFHIFWVSLLRVRGQ